MTPEQAKVELETLNAELNDVLQRYLPRLGDMQAVAVVVRTPRGFGVFSQQSHAYLSDAFAQLAIIYNEGHRPYAAVPARDKSRG